MKIALLSDIHGNTIALDAVLKDIAAQGGVDAHWVLGDLAALGPDPVGALERLSKLREVQFIRGNTDRYVAFGDRPAPTLDEAAKDAKLLPSLVEVANTFAWTQGMITATGWLDWLRELPLEMRVDLPDGTRFLAVHASQGKDDGPGVLPGMKDEELARLFDGCDAGLVCIGHTHVPSEQRWRGMQIVNPGAVSFSLAADKRASYALLDAGPDGYKVTHCWVEYDRAAVIRQLEALGHPGRGMLIRRFSEAG